MEPDDQPRYHRDTLEQMVRLLLQDVVNRGLDELVDGNPEAAASALATLFKVLEKLSPEHTPTILGAVNGEVSSRAIVATLGGDVSAPWRDAGIYDPVDIKAWEALMVTPEEAAQFTQYGVTPLRVFAWEMDGSSFFSANEICDYEKLGWSPDHFCVRVGYETGANSYEIIETLKDIPPGELSETTLRFALNWKAAFPDKFNLDTYKDFVKLSEMVDVEEAEQWGELPDVKNGRLLWGASSNKKH